MTVIKRCAAAGATLALGLALTACGGGGADVKTGASVEDFCAAYNAEGVEEPELDPEAGPEEQAQAFLDYVKEQIGTLEDVGVPDDMPEEAQEGFALAVEQVQNLDTDDAVKALEEANSDEFLELEEGDQEKVDAFDDYASENC